MNIEKLIASEGATDDSVHSRAYAQALRDQYEFYKDSTRLQLLHAQEIWREDYKQHVGPTHRNTAALMVLYLLLEEKSA